MFSNVMHNPNPLVRYGAAALIVFGPLYILSSYGVSFSWNIAVIVGLAFIVWRFGGRA